MAVAKLGALKAACGKHKVEVDAVRIEQGETLWIDGVPDRADDGTIALRGDSGVTAIVREADILEVLEKGDRYFVKVRTDADVLARAETVVKANPKLSTCDCGDTDDRVSYLKKLPEWLDVDVTIPGGTGLTDWRCFERCMPDFYCRVVDVIDGIPIYSCNLRYRCERICMPGPA